MHKLPPEPRAIVELPAEVIAAIAAGEVVERPAVVVKELIENALDAGATRISIELIRGGLDSIIVSDNGHGMSVENLKKAFLPHTTSKIKTLDDLEQLLSFGFRGEALASIAQVSRFTLASRPANNTAGYFVQLVHGALVDEAPIGMPVGTRCQVEQLFSRLPARRKFLKAPATEQRAIIALVSAAALTHPQVGFDLSDNGTPLLNLPPTNNLLERVSEVLRHPSEKYLNIATPQLNSSSEKLITLTGFIGAPQIARRTRFQQYLAINHRPISHPGIAKVIKTAYGSLLEPRAEPVFALNILLSPELVDVNVHPRKEMVALVNEAEILQEIAAVIKTTLANHDVSYHLPLSPQSGLLEFNDPAFNGPLRTASVATAQALRQLVKPWLTHQPVNQERLPEIAQLHLTYLVAETPEGYLLVDQHAAHERILFEQFKAGLTESQHSDSTSTITRLPQPVLISLSPTESAAMQLHSETLAHLGFEVTAYAQHTWAVTALPSLLSDRDPEKLIKEILEEALEDRPLTGVDRLAERTLAYLACRTAVKAGDELGLTERRNLLAKLAETPNNATCPHGRPTMISYQLRDLERMFKRR